VQFKNTANDEKIYWAALERAKKLQKPMWMHWTDMKPGIVLLLTLILTCLLGELLIFDHARLFHTAVAIDSNAEYVKFHIHTFLNLFCVAFQNEEASMYILNVTRVRRSVSGTEGVAKGAVGDRYCLLL